MKKILILASLLLINGCATYTFVHPQKSQAQMMQQEKECNYDASKALAYKGAGVGKEVDKYYIKKECMEMHGYSEVEVKK